MAAISHHSSIWKCFFAEGWLLSGPRNSPRRMSKGAPSLVPISNISLCSIWQILPLGVGGAAMCGRGGSSGSTVEIDRMNTYYIEDLSKSLLSLPTSTLIRFPSVMGRWGSSEPFRRSLTSLPQCLSRNTACLPNDRFHMCMYINCDNGVKWLCGFVGVAQRAQSSVRNTNKVWGAAQTFRLAGNVHFTGIVVPRIDPAPTLVVGIMPLRLHILNKNR